MSDIWRNFVRGLCEPVCQLCGGPALSIDLCAGCFRDLPRGGRSCPRCAAALPRGGVCGACLRRPPAWDAAVAAFRYAFPVDRLIRRLKYDGRLEHGRLLGRLLGRAVRHRPTPDLVLPVPLHVSRWRERGFNQAAEIARSLTRASSLALADGLCLRVRATPPLWRMGPGARHRLLAGAFELRRPLPAGARVAIVDDVLTSGATAGALARSLRRAGAGWIEVWAVARAEGLPPDPQGPQDPASA